MSRRFWLKILFFSMTFAASASYAESKIPSFDDVTNQAWQQSMQSTQAADQQQQQEVDRARQQAQIREQQGLQNTIQNTVKNLQAQQSPAQAPAPGGAPSPSSVVAVPPQGEQQSKTFKPQPLPETGKENPYLRPNPWSDSNKNPYAGQQYAPTSQSNQANPAQQGTPGIFNPGFKSVHQTGPQQQPRQTTPVNIFSR